MLGRTVKEAQGWGIQVEVMGVDSDVSENLRGEGIPGDLTKDRPFAEHLDLAKGGLIDPGFPCSTFSRQAPGLPPPVRTKDHPYGMPNNSLA